MPAIFADQRLSQPIRWNRHVLFRIAQSSEQEVITRVPMYTDCYALACLAADPNRTDSGRLDAVPRAERFRRLALQRPTRALRPAKECCLEDSTATGPFIAGLHRRAYLSYRFRGKHIAHNLSSACQWEG